MADLPELDTERESDWGGVRRKAAGRPLRVLIVDDEPNVCDVLRDACSRLGCLVTTFNSGEQAIAEARREGFDVVFLDIRMPGLNGAQVLRVLRRLVPRATFVMITAYAESELVDESLESGAFICLSKPLGISEIRDLLQSVSEDRGDAWALVGGAEES